MLKPLANKLLAMAISVKMKLFPNLKLNLRSIQKAKSMAQASLKEAVIVTLDGHKMVLDSKDSLRLSLFKIYEPVATEFVKRELKEGDTVIDVGANIGYFSLLMAKMVGERGIVFAFEPEKTNFEILTHNAELNGYGQIRAIKKAVSNEKASIRLYKSDSNNGDHRISKGTEARNSEVVESCILDEELSQIDSVKLIKMDIQGAEALALIGMRKLIEKSSKVIIISEFMPSAIVESGQDPAKFLHTLDNLGFSCSIINEEKQTIDEVSFSELIKQTENDEIFEINLIMKKM